MAAAPFGLEGTPHPARVRGGPDREQCRARGLGPCRVAHLQRRRGGGVVTEDHDGRVVRREECRDRLGTVARQVEASPPARLDWRADHAAVDVGCATRRDDLCDIACSRRRDRVRVDVDAGELPVGGLGARHRAWRPAGRATPSRPIRVRAQRRSRHRGGRRCRRVLATRRSDLRSRRARRRRPSVTRHRPTPPSSPGAANRQCECHSRTRKLRRIRVRIQSARAGRAVRAVVDTGHHTGLVACPGRGGRGARGSTRCGCRSTSSRSTATPSGSRPPVLGGRAGVLDPFVTLGFLAASTTTLRLGTGVTLISQRQPLFVAKEAATVDYLLGRSPRPRRRRRVDPAGVRGPPAATGGSGPARRPQPRDHAHALGRRSVRVPREGLRARAVVCVPQAGAAAASADPRRWSQRRRAPARRVLRARVVRVQPRRRGVRGTSSSGSTR